MRIKICTKCKVEKSLSEFYKDIGQSSGLRPECKECYNKIRKIYYIKNFNYISKRNTDYVKNHKNKIKKYKHKYYLQHKAKSAISARKSRLKIEYKITLENYNELLKKQNSVCAICGEKETVKNCKGEIRKLSIDHNHRTGKVRGLLCNKCNNLLGRAKEDYKILNNAIKYLKEKNTIVLAGGCFDLLHSGHLNILEKAKSLGDYLIVSVSTSELMKEKGKIEIVPFKDRCRMVKALKCVDEVIPETKIFDIDQFRKVKADYFVIGDDWKNRTDIDRLNWLKHNNKIIFFPYTEGISTTFIKKSIKTKCKK